jgi:hypothetical protein
MKHLLESKVYAKKPSIAKSGTPVVRVPDASLAPVRGIYGAS